MHVRKQRANVDSFTGGGVVGKAHSDCFAAELNVPWTCKTLYPEGSREVGDEPPKNPGQFLETCHCSASSWASGYIQFRVSTCG